MNTLEDKQSHKVTNTGFAYEINQEALDDWELLEKLRFIDEDPGYIVDVAYTLLGSEQVEMLKEHVRKTDGRCTASAMMREINDIFKGGKEIKNS